jgi:aspartate carbamoyltransferase regulatory subunit
MINSVAYNCKNKNCATTQVVLASSLLTRGEEYPLRLRCTDCSERHLYDEHEIEHI